jgi:flagellar motor component MotA
LSFSYLRDFPGLIYIFLPTFLLLAISGNFKIFFKTIKYIFKNQKLSVSQKTSSENAVRTLRKLLLLEGILATLGGFTGMLCNLEDRSMLGISFTIACVPMIYGLLVNLILLPVESKISLLCDSE